MRYVKIDISDDSPLPRQHAGQNQEPRRERRTRD